jgi:hypothetical protein
MPTCCQFFPRTPRRHRVHAGASPTAESTLVPPWSHPPPSGPRRRHAREPHRPPSHCCLTSVQRSLCHHYHWTCMWTRLLLRIRSPWPAGSSSTTDSSSTSPRHRHDVRTPDASVLLDYLHTVSSLMIAARASDRSSSRFAVALTLSDAGACPIFSS